MEDSTCHPQIKSGASHIFVILKLFMKKFESKVHIKFAIVYSKFLITDQIFDSSFLNCQYEIFIDFFYCGYNQLYGIYVLIDYSLPQPISECILQDVIKVYIQPYLKQIWFVHSHFMKAWSMVSPLLRHLGQKRGQFTHLLFRSTLIRTTLLRILQVRVFVLGWVFKFQNFCQVLFLIL